MAIVNTATKRLAGVQPRMLPTPSGIGVLSTIALTTAIALNDVVNFMDLASAPALSPVAVGNGPTIMNFLLDSDQIDTNGSPTLTYHLGNTGSAQRFLTSSTIGRTGGVVGPTKAGTIGYQPFAASFGTYPTASYLTTTIFLTIAAAAATAAAGTVRLMVNISYDP